MALKVAIQFASVIMYTLLIDVVRDSSVVPAFLFIACMTWVIIHVRTMPFMSSYMNALVGGLAALPTWSAAILCLMAYFTPEDISVALFLGLPLCFMLGFLITYVHEHSVYS